MIDPTPAQKLIRDTPDLAMVIVAPAGCGKTEALALRVAGMIERRAVVHPRKVLVATFSNRARDNLKDRLSSYVPSRQMRDRVVVTNFHGLSARVIRAHGSVVGLTPDWILPESDWIGEQCSRRHLSFKVAGEIKDLLRDLKLRSLTDNEVMSALQAAGNSVAEELETKRRAERRLTYDDLPRLAELILAVEGVAGLYANHFQAVIVDEFQDLTPQQLRIVKILGSGKTTFAGDLAQGIYGFAGAEPDAVFAEIVADCPPPITITDSHRSSPAVLDMVNALAPRTGGTPLVSVDPSSWPSGGLSGVVGFPSTAAEAEWSVKFARRVLKNAPEHRIGVIARTSARRRFADLAFDNSGLDCHRWEDGILDTDTAQSVKSMLKALDAAEYEGAADSIEFLRARAGLQLVQDPATRSSLADGLRWCDELLAEGVDADEIVDRIRVGDADTLLQRPGVHLLTGHVGKGQQFDWVVVVGAEEGCIPFFLATTPDEIEEEARVLGVMLSRARHGALILHAGSVEAASGVSYGKDRSSFVGDFESVGSTLFGKGPVQDWVMNAPWDDLAKR